MPGCVLRAQTVGSGIELDMFSLLRLLPATGVGLGGAGTE